jgi:selenocysteine-specific elongation factor
VITGTVLAGKAKVGDVIELPALKQEKKIKSMQMFRKPVQSCKQGDRVGICLAQLDASLIERGIAAKPGSMKPTDCVILIVRRIPYFVGEIKSKAKLHISIGHQTVIGQVSFFSCHGMIDEQSMHFNTNSLKSVDSKIDFSTKI